MSPSSLNHIRYRSKICKYNLYIRGTVVDEETASLHDVEWANDCVALYRRGRRRHYAEDPVVQLAGPLLPIISQDDRVCYSKHRLGFGHNYFK